MKDLYKLKQAEYSIGAELALKNAIQHMDVSTLLSEKKFYSMAVNHCIISAEELVKASVLKLKSIDNSIKLPKLKEYFFSHEIKHKSIFKLLHSVRELNKSKKEIQELNKLFSTLAILLIAAVAYHYITKKPIINEESTISSIEGLRLFSTYVELSDKRVWQTPQNMITKEMCEGIQQLSMVIHKGLLATLFSGEVNKNNISVIVDKLNSEKE